MPSKLETRAVLAGARYQGVTLTHTMRLDDDHGDDVLCRRVRVGNLADRFADTSGIDKPPTCGECLRRDPRFTARAR